jgi:beta-ribofuranosylaminobenzene 5'-phosphate synthase
MKICITTPSRLHFSLIDLNGRLGRIDGSIGLALRSPNTIVETSISDRQKILGNKEREEEINNVINRVKNYFNIKDNFEFNFMKIIPSHVGLGSTTQLYLAIAKSIIELKSIQASVQELAKAVRRGGTSGIGMGIFDKGGFILDGGHSFGKNKEKTEFVPSDYSPALPPPIISRLEFPNWHIILLIPKTQGLYGLKELECFKRYFPIPSKMVGDICRVIIMKLLPSIINQDIDEFDESINLINRIKRIRFSGKIKTLVKKINSIGGKAISITSSGPTIFVFTESQKVVEECNELKQHYYLEDVIITNAENRGATIEKINNSF